VNVTDLCTASQQQHVTFVLLLFPRHLNDMAKHTHWTYLPLQLLITPVRILLMCHFCHYMVLN